MLRPTSEYPCSDHFRTLKEWVALITTAPLLGILEKHGIDIPWMEKTEQFVWDEFERIKEKHVFCYLCVTRWLTFLKHTRTQPQACEVVKNLQRGILAEGVICNDTSDDGWGLYGKPHRLNYGPIPDSILYSIFKKEDIETDLDELIKKQQKDGSWATWYGISEGAKLEWAGTQTLCSLKTIKNYGKIEM